MLAPPSQQPSQPSLGRPGGDFRRRIFLAASGRHLGLDVWADEHVRHLRGASEVNLFELSNLAMTNSLRTWTWAIKVVSLSHWTWWSSIVMLVYVSLPEGKLKTEDLCTKCCCLGVCLGVGRGGWEWVHVYDRSRILCWQFLFDAFPPNWYCFALSFRDFSH